jgi:hypothetical protein
VSAAWANRSPTLAAVCLLGGVVTVGCAARSVPDPRAAAAAYADAAKHGDSHAIYGMMTKSAQAQRSEMAVADMVAAERSELAEQAQAVTSKDARVQATARLRFEDGEEAALDLDNGRYTVTAAGALPGGARTPEEALEQLRRVAARRSYAGLMRVLSPATRAMIEADLRTLVTGLEKPDTLQVKVQGDTATVSVPGGHVVRLKRDGGIWHVDYFD